jgi:hypothetical protein
MKILKAVAMISYSLGIGILSVAGGILFIGLVVLVFSGRFAEIPEALLIYVPAMAVGWLLMKGGAIYLDRQP